MTQRNESRWRRWLQPTPIALPTIDPQLCNLPAIERAGEVLRYSVLRAEYWLSSGGTLRAWLRLNVKVATFVALPLALLAPLVRVAVTEAATCSTLLVEISRNLVLTVMWAAAGVGLLILTALLLRLLSNRSRKGRF